MPENQPAYGGPIFTQKYKLIAQQLSREYYPAEQRLISLGDHEHPKYANSFPMLRFGASLNSGFTRFALCANYPDTFNFIVYV